MAMSNGEQRRAWAMADMVARYRAPSVTTTLPEHSSGGAESGPLMGLASTSRIRHGCGSYLVSSCMIRVFLVDREAKIVCLK